MIEDIREVVRRPPGRFEAIPDDLTAQEIAEQAASAAKGKIFKTILCHRRQQIIWPVTPPFEIL